MKSKKQVKLEWSILIAGYIFLSLVAVLITGDWLIGGIGLFASTAYTWGWYRCWCFHGIGWPEEQEDAKLIEEENE
jgi:hypothetical protein